MRVVLADPGVRPAPPPSSLRRPPARRGLGAPELSAVRLTIFTGALLVAFAGMHVTLEGFGWLVPLAATVIVPALAVGIARAFGRRSWQPGVAGLVAGLATLTVGFAREQSLLGVVPTLDTVARFVELANAGGRSIQTQRIPADADEGILFLLALLAVASVALVAPALDRAPAVAALPLLVVLDIPVAVRAGIAEPGWFVLVALGYLALLRVGRRRTTVGGLVVVTAVALVGSLTLPAAFPPAREPVGDGGSGFGTGLNPIINLGEDLRRDVAVDALTYTTDARGGLYLRLATLDRFTGLSWEPDNGGIDPTFDVDEFPTPPGLATEVPRVQHSADIQVEDVSGRWLPVPYPAVSIEGLDGVWNFEPDGLAVRSSGTDVAGQDYTVQFLDVEPNREQLLADFEPDVASRYLDLPDELPPILEQTAEQFAGLPTSYEQAIALQEFFTGPDFLYSLDAPVEGDFDGTGVGVIAEFLEVRSGYCVHYASAMAVLARVLDIPARVTVGFQPGEASGVGGEFQVTSSDLHAWPELYFEGIGWLRFEPTPGRGAPPTYSSIDAVDDPETPEFEGVNPSAAPAPSTPAGPDGPVEPTTAPDAQAPVAEADDPTPVVLAVALGILALLLTPAAARAVVRARRMRRVRDAGDAEAAWAEIRDTAHDHDWVAPDSETPRQLGARLAAVVGESEVGALRGGVETAAYAPPGRAAMTVEDVDLLRRAIARAATLKVRLLAVFAPPSLFARLGFERRDGEADRQ